MKIPSNLWRRLGLGLLGVLLIVALVYVVMRSGPLAPVRVTVTQATVGSLSPSLFGIGTVEARRAYLIGPTAAGRVSKVLVDVGDTVQAGQLLAEMDPVDLDERAAALEASIARAGSAIAAAQAQRRDAQARSELAAITARRYVELGAQNFMSAGAVEAKQQEQASADAAVAAADANLAAARQDTQRLAAERAGLRQQRDNVRLLAPANGRGHQPRRRSRVHRGGGASRAAAHRAHVLVDPGAAGPGPLGRSGRRAAGLDRAALEPERAPVRQGGSGGGHERQHHRGTPGPGGHGHAARRPVHRRTGRGHVDAAGHGPGGVAAQPRPSTSGRPGRRVAHRGRQAPLRCRCASGRPASTARCRCSKA